jgi:uncharacterized protein
MNLSPASRIALAIIRVYKIGLSPLFAGSCRYTPGCADYMSESISRFGFVRGGWLGTKRLCKCHPFGGHGFDPVPTDVNHVDPQIDPEIDRSLDQPKITSSPAQ